MTTLAQGYAVPQHLHAVMLNVNLATITLQHATVLHAIKAVPYHHIQAAAELDAH